MESQFYNSNRKSYVQPQCFDCIYDVSLKYAKLSLKKYNEINEKKKEEKKNHKEIEDSTDKLDNSNKENLKKKQNLNYDIEKILKDKLYSIFKNNISPNETATILFHEARKMPKTLYNVVQFIDPWKDIRDLSNKIAESLIPIVEKDIFEKKNNYNKLLRAFQWALAGNNLDFGTAGHSVKIDGKEINNLLEQVLKQGFKRNDFNKLWNIIQIKDNKKIMYILDNAGEIVFDKIVIKELKKLGKSVVAVVKGGPISNDAIMHDAEQVGLTNICEVITTGSPDLGFFPTNNSKDFIKQLNNADLVIAKGQANWESIYAYQHMLRDDLPWFAVLKIKCKVHADLFGFPLGSYVFYKICTNDFLNEKKFTDSC